MNVLILSTSIGQIMPPSPIKDHSERLVYEYLVRQGLEVLHHPDGEHNPPDFAIDGRIGIEVRRLNQHWLNGQTHFGIEVREDALYSLVEEVLDEFGAPTGGVSYWVACGFQNPVPEPKAFKKLLRNALRERMNDRPMPEISIGTVDLRFYATAEMPRLFNLGCRSNHDGGGFIVAELIKNLAICIAEKTRKIARVQDRYAEWWLAFVDHISYGILDANEVQVIRGDTPIPAPWTKVLLVSTETRRVWDLAEMPTEK